MGVYFRFNGSDGSQNVLILMVRFLLRLVNTSYKIVEWVPVQSERKKSSVDFSSASFLLPYFRMQNRLILYDICELLLVVFFEKKNFIQWNSFGAFSTSNFFNYTIQLSVSLCHRLDRFFLSFDFPWMKEQKKKIYNLIDLSYWILHLILYYIYLNVLAYGILKCSRISEKKMIGNFTY